MKIGIVVNDIMTEQSGYTSIRIAMWATNRGHEVWFIGLGDFAYDPEEHTSARVRRTSRKNYKSSDNLPFRFTGETGDQGTDYR